LAKSIRAGVKKSKAKEKENKNKLKDGNNDDGFAVPQKKVCTNEEKPFLNMMNKENLIKSKIVELLKQSQLEVDSKNDEKGSDNPDLSHDNSEKNNDKNATQSNGNESHLNTKDNNSVENLKNEKEGDNDKKEEKKEEKKEYSEIEFKKINTIDDLLELGGDHMKHELMRLGLKCGGKVQERAQRLFDIKLNPNLLLDPKYIATVKKNGN